MNAVRKFFQLLSGHWIDTAMDEVRDKVSMFAKQVNEMSVRAQLDGEDHWFLEGKCKDNRTDGVQDD